MLTLVSVEDSEANHKWEEDSVSLSRALEEVSYLTFSEEVATITTMQTWVVSTTIWEANLTANHMVNQTLLAQHQRSITGPRQDSEYFPSWQKVTTKEP